MKVSHQTDHGKYIIGDSVELLKGDLGKSLKGKVQLILTSPPFPLNKKKAMGTLLVRNTKNGFQNWPPYFQIYLQMMDQSSLS